MRTPFTSIYDRRKGCVRTYPALIFCTHWFSSENKRWVEFAPKRFACLPVGRLCKTKHWGFIQNP